jgi:hypothetical protein
MADLSLDHFIGDRQQIRWYFEAKGFRRPEIDSQFEFDWHKDGDVTRFRALQDLVGYIGGTASMFCLVRPIGH